MTKAQYFIRIIKGFLLTVGGGLIFSSPQEAAVLICFSGVMELVQTFVDLNSPPKS